MNSEAPESAGLIELLTWLDVNKKKLVMGAAAFVAIGFAVSVVRYAKNQKELGASEALLELRTPLNAPTNTPPASSSAFLKIAEDFKGTSAAERAEFLAAATLHTEEKYEQARAAFEKFAGQYPSSAWVAAAQFGVGSSWEALKNPEKAMAAYKTVVDTYPNSSAVADARLAIARLHESKKEPEMALKIYDSLTGTNSVSARAGDASIRKEALLRQFPYLAKPKTNAAVTGTTTVVAPPPQKLEPVSKTTNAPAK